MAQEANSESSATAKDATIARLQAQVDHLQKQVARPDKALRISPLRETAPADQEEVSSVAPPARRHVAMCFKDYCPCDPPQVGMDTILCDKLEQGEQPAVDFMIAGRAAREYRREMATGDY